MAGRSFKPASYLASAAQQKPSRASRPSFVRTSSSSSTHSNKSEDLFLATFRALNTGTDGPQDGNWSLGGASPRGHTSGNISPGSCSNQKPSETPTRKRSKPIAIELPGRKSPSAYTPLTARGDLNGGYFPDFEDVHHKSYRAHPFAPHHQSGASTPGSPSNMSASSTQSSPGSEVTPRGPASVLSPVNPTFPIIESLGIPMGKYYPSNYRSPVTSAPLTPDIRPAALPPSNLQIPAMTNSKSKRKQGHERDSSDVKRKLQQYQRDMIAQARVASSQGSSGLSMPEPISPRLLPLGSPGPITPFELEEEQGYIVAGTRSRGPSLIGNGLEKAKQKQIVDSMINQEKGRAARIESPTMSPQI